MRRRARQALAAAGILVLYVTTGCNGFFVYPGSANGGTGSSTSDYVFVANGSTTSQSLAVFAVGSGTMTSVTGSPFALGFVPTSVAVNPTNTIVYVAGISNTGAGSVISAYSIAATGVLTLLTTNPVSVTETAIAISPDGNWLLGLDPLGSAANEAQVDVFHIVNSSGQLVSEAPAGVGGVFGYPVQASPVPKDLKFAPNGTYVFAAMGTGGDVAFPFNTASGVLSNPSWIQAPAGLTSDQGVGVSPDSTQLYIARSGAAPGLAVYSVGGFAQIGSTLAVGQQPVSVVVNKSGSDVYVANQGDGTISGYAVASGGAVSVMNPATNTATSPPIAIAIDNSGNYLLAISNSGSPALTMYSFTSAGQLTQVASSTTGTAPTGPVAIATTR